MCISTEHTQGTAGVTVSAASRYFAQANEQLTKVGGILGPGQQGLGSGFGYSGPNFPILTLGSREPWAISVAFRVVNLMLICYLDCGG